jgi:hypothetical protein
MLKKNDKDNAAADAPSKEDADKNKSKIIYHFLKIN